MSGFCGVGWCVVYVLFGNLIFNLDDSRFVFFFVYDLITNASFLKGGDGKVIIAAEFRFKQNFYWKLNQEIKATQSEAKDAVSGSFQLNWFLGSYSQRMLIECWNFIIRSLIKFMLFQVQDHPRPGPDSTSPFVIIKKYVLKAKSSEFVLCLINFVILMSLFVLRFFSVMMLSVTSFKVNKIPKCDKERAWVSESEYRRKGMKKSWKLFLTLMRSRVIKKFLLNRNNKQKKVRVINSIFILKKFPRLLRKNFHFDFLSFSFIWHSILMIILFVIFGAARCFVLFTIITLVLSLRYVRQIIFVRWCMNDWFLSKRFFICLICWVSDYFVFWFLICVFNLNLLCMHHAVLRILIKDYFWWSPSTTGKR